MTKLQFDTENRIALKKAKQAAWQALGPAIIERPLRYIKKEMSSYQVNEKTGKQELVISPLYFMAKDFADAGDGEAVKFMALTVLRGGVNA
jgi:hypothetical protein